MHFALTEEQVALRDGVRELLADRCTPAVVRSAADTDPAPLWEALTGLGVLGVAVPEEVGGLGLTFTDLVPVLEETGYAAVPLPVAETAAVAAPLFAAAGDARLPELLAGKTRVALAQRDGLVPFGDRADLVLVLDDDRARVVTPYQMRKITTVDGARPVVRCGLTGGAIVTGEARLVGAARARAALATAAQLVGLGRRMLDLTVHYVRDRRQFGVPVGSFQAVKHHLADALLRLEFAAPAVLAAAWAVDHGADTVERDVSVAAVLAGEAAQHTAKAAIQCHGAMGYTVEYDLHLFAKRAWALVAGADLGGHLDRLTEEVLQ
jgi:alkylation response protein AidB-like acyl-CoA dehydrogenase